MTPKKHIEFAPTSGNGAQKAPWDRKAHSIYEDLIFKDQFSDRKLAFEPGPNWIRVVPALMESDNWLLHVPAVSLKHARFAHPRVFEKGSKSIFDRAYHWFSTHAPDKTL